MICNKINETDKYSSADDITDKSRNDVSDELPPRE